MGYGVTVPKGRLPVFTTDTEEQARKLVVACCQTDAAGNYYAQELAEEQTLENLQKFSDKLARVWQLMKDRGTL